MNLVEMAGDRPR